jgi:hypothetical protein
MSYTVVMFDGLAISPYLQRGDSQDIGTGASLSSFLPLPGGGYYDNYQSKRSPQGIRPINKSGVFWGTDAELRAELQAWRAKLGQRGRLTVEWDDGTLMWQWARLQDVSAPRGSNVKGGWQPFSLTWITAAQNWRGVVHDSEGWTWGDGSWSFGDGSAEMGVGGETFTLTALQETVTVTHNGSIDAANVKLVFDIAGTWQDLTIINETTGQQIVVDRASTVARPLFEIDAGARSVYLGGPAATISAAYRAGNTVFIVTAAPHGVTSGQSVRIAGTGLYDGDYFLPSVGSTTQLSVSLSPMHAGWGTVMTGTVRWLADLYSLTTFYDRTRWLVLAPGDNVLRFIWSPVAPTSAELRVEFADHYA